jgi:hypothetical protein
MREAVFYIGRVVKTGFSQEEFIEKLFDPSPYDDRKNVWNIVNMLGYENNGRKYYFGKLNKANPDATVSVMTEDYKQEIEKEEPNMIIASSEFIYIPDYSGIAFHSIPNHIESKKFISVFCAIIEKSLKNFFVECKINLINDIESFYKKLNDFEMISKMKAVVNPPNPLFGKLWESLKTYLEERNATELRIQEWNKDGILKTQIKELIQLILKGNKEEIEKYIQTHPLLSTLDLSILMSLDGYGTGRIDGKAKGQHVFIKTHEQAIHFSMIKEQLTEISVYEKTEEIFLRISNERYMEH